MPLFGEGARDRARLVQTLDDLGPTSVDALSRALSWPANRTARALRSLARSGAAITYDADTGQVRPSHLPVAVPPPAASPSSSTGTTVAEAGDLPRPGLCSVCRQPLTATGTPGSFYCSHCGNLETHAAPARSVGPSISRSGGVRREGGLDDRQAQELFAAWVTAQPIPCPRCRHPLNHRGLQSYACPSCGEVVTFADSGVTATPPPAA